MKILKKIGGTLMLPVAVYIAMMILCYANGKMYYGTWEMWRTLIVDIAISVTSALGIGLQFKNGRFDFSGGAIMLVAGIVAGHVAKDNGNSVVVMVVVAFALCIILSLVVALLYVYGRVPIIIATIGMALLYEAISCIIYNGQGVTLVSNNTLRLFSTYPTVLIPGVLAILVYAFYGRFTKTGKQSMLLANNQQSAVNIGINEPKNVIISYLYSGVLFGFATLIWLATAIHKASFSSLSTVGELFTNILPVFIGLMLMNFCGDTIGTLMGSISLCLLSYALKAVFDNEMGSAITTIVTGVFILVLNVVSAQGTNWINGIKKLFTREKETA